MTNDEWSICARLFAIRHSAFVIQRLLHPLDLFDGAFPGKDDQIAAEFAGEFDAGGARDGHLRRGVDGKIRRELANEPGNADVLNDCGIHAGGDDAAQIISGVRELVFEDERVEGDVAADAAAMQEFHQARQVGLGEIMRAHSGVEFVETEIDRVSAVFDGGFGAFPIAGGRKELGQRSRGIERGFAGGGLR